MPSLVATQSSRFYGNNVIRAAFVLALFGWGVGFYGPPIFLHAVLARTGWPLPLVSAAVTFHFLFGAAVVACLPRIHRRCGIPATTLIGAILLAAGVLGWAAAVEPWQLFVAAMFTGGGWVPLGAAGINAIISPWFVQKRPLALAKAYNGASVGGMLFSPLWAVAIDRMGFPATAMMVGLTMIAVVLSIACRELAGTPAGEGQAADGLAQACGSAPAVPAGADAQVCPTLWKDRRFLTLAAAMSLGLFAQIGLITQLFSLMVPSMGPRLAGGIMALATGCGMGGRLLMGWLLGRYADRRRAAAASYSVQAAGTLALLIAGPEHFALLVLGVVLFGLGIGNATSLPPLIAQADFAPVDTPRVVARSVALSQALYAFAPAVLAGLMVGTAHAAPSLGATTDAYFIVIFLLQALAAACVLSGSRPRALHLAKAAGDVAVTTRRV
ncbi:MFS transporter [Acidovorax sp. Be4]|uniref:MFS transporter n=1 Tax=Acidovorax bellezanensis TaxID=2976702 RepID=A0ABT2PHP2_9BURK|nr:MFS transporter [Acidovorax sp. Be4]MCT9809983.1 MFS transporter [Acidovorax sp. Be4]